MSEKDGSMNNSMLNMDEYMAQFNAVNEQLKKQQEALSELQKGINNVLISAAQSTLSLNVKPAYSIKSGFEGNDASLLALALKKYGYTASIQNSSADLQPDHQSINVDEPKEESNGRKGSISSQNVRSNPKSTPLPTVPNPPLRMPYMLSQPRVVKFEPSAVKRKASQRLPPRDYPLWKPQWVKPKSINPTQQKMDLAWWYIMCAVHIFMVFAVPIIVGFKVDLIVQFIVSILLTLFYALDSGINLKRLISSPMEAQCWFHAILQKTCSCVKDSKKETPFKAYLSRMAVIDLLTVVPWDLITGAYYLLLLRVPRIIFYPLHLKRPTSYFAWVIVFLHYHACMHFLVGRYTDYSGWTAVEKANALNLDLAGQYSWAIYFSVGNVFPITGFHPTGIWQLWWTVIFVIGGGLGMVLLTAWLSAYFVHSWEKKWKLRGAREYFNRLGMDETFCTRAQRFFELKFLGPYQHEEWVLKELPDDLYVEYLAQSTVKMLKEVPFWANHPQKDEFVFEVMLRLVPMYVGRGEVLFEEGKRSDFMYFIREGHIRLQPTGILMLKDTFFGDMAFEGNGIASYTATAESDCVLFALSRSNYLAVRQMFK